LSGSFLSYKQGRDRNGVNYGGNILRDYTNRTGDHNVHFLQGQQVRVILGEATASYQFRPGWFLDLRLRLRNQIDVESGLSMFRNQIFGIGLRVNTAPRRHFF